MIIKKITSVLLSAAIAGGVLLFSPFQAIGAGTEDLVSLDPMKGVSTVLTFNNGDQLTRSGLLQTAESEQNNALKNVAAYEIVVKGTPAVRVESRGTDSAKREMSNAYYAITFSIPGTTKEGFITGLPAERTDAIQEKVVQGILSEAQTGDKSFEVEDAGIIDAEKVMQKGYDYDLCWAGSDSNMLHYTGWGKKAGFQTEDDLFDLYAENFNDKGYFEQNGIEWFFNGTLGSDHPDKSLPKYYGNSGRFLPDYPAENYVSTEYFDKAKSMAEALGRMTASLNSGNAVGISIITSTTTAHAITLWGYITDKSVPETDVAHYTDLIFADNEDHNTFGKDRRLAPNTLCVNKFYESVDEYGRYGKEGETVYTMVNGAMHSYTSLKPYSDDLPKETDPDATRDKVHDPDFAALGAEISSYRYSETTSASLVKSGEVYFTVDTNNYSDVDWYDALDVRVTVRNKANAAETVSNTHFSNTKNVTYAKRTSWLNPVTLAAGDYTAKVTINPDKSVKEAFYLNNTYSFDFKVADAPYDESKMTVAAASESKPSDADEIVSLSYGDIDPAFLSGVTEATCYVNQYSDGSWGSDGMVEITSTYDGGVLPKTVRFSKGSAEKYRCKLRVSSGGIQYELYTNELPNRYAKLNVAVSPEDLTLSPVNYGAVSLSEGEEIGVTIGYQTSNYDKDFSGAYSIEAVYADGSAVTLLQPQALTLKSGETTGKISFKSWDTPLTNSVALRLVITSQDESAATRSEKNLGELQVTERGSAVVDTAEDTDNPYDGKISLREAVAFSGVSGTPVTFAKELKTVSVNKTILISGKVEICHNDPVNRFLIHGSGLFRVLEGGSLTLRNLCLEPSQDAEVEHGGAVYVQGGSMYADNCRFTGCSSTVSGGAIYAVGGHVRVRDTQFYMCVSPKAAAIFLESNAKADALNSTFAFSMRSATVLENHGSRLTLVDSNITNNQLMFDGRCVIVSDGETNVINSIIMSNATQTDVNGNARYFAVAYDTACNGVTYDEYSRLYQPEELFYLSHLGKPMYDELSFGVAPRLREPAAQGCLVTAAEGTLCLSRDGAAYTDTGVAAAWTAEELSVDYVGNEHGTIFGAYSKLFVPYRLGDVNGDGNVTVADVTLLQQFVAGFQVTDPERVKQCGKIIHRGSFDGGITVSDATEIQKYIAELETAYPIGTAIESN